MNILINKELLTKNGIAVLKLGREFISLKKDDRIEPIGVYAEKLHLGRGTIQSALRFLEETGAVKLEPKGHLGTFIENIDYRKLWDVAGLGSITGAMPLPYSRRYEGLATGLYKAFEKADIPFNMAYMRGGYKRQEALEQLKYDFIIMSKLAADMSIFSGKDVETVLDFGNYSYVKDHKVLFANPEDDEITDGMRVALDKSSPDHFILTTYECEDKKVDYVELTYNQILKSLLDKKIDAAVWNIDEISDRNINIPYYDLKSPKALKIKEDDTRAVLVARKSDWGLSGILRNIIDKQYVLDIQMKVLREEMLPSY